MAPVVFLEVGGRALAGWYSSLSEGEAGGTGGAAGWVVELVVGAAVAAAAGWVVEAALAAAAGRVVELVVGAAVVAAAERETRSVGAGRAVLFLLVEVGRAVLFLLIEAGGPEEDMVMVVVVLEA